MALQVRLDLTPAQFGIVLRALGSYVTQQAATAEDRSATHEERRKARAESLLAKELLDKLRVD